MRVGSQCEWVHLCEWVRGVSGFVGASGFVGVCRCEWVRDASGFVVVRRCEWVRGAMISLLSLSLSLCVVRKWRDDLDDR